MESSNQINPNQAPVPPLPKKEKEFIGRAVDNGVIRFLSVSQIVAFDPSQESGCPRRWFFQKIQGKKEEETVQQEAGKEYAANLQHYEETGEDILVPVLRAGKHLFPKPGSDLECERALSRPSMRTIQLRDQYSRDASKKEELERSILRDTINTIKLREQYVKNPSESNLQHLKFAAVLTANNIPIIGAADIRHRRQNFVDNDGVTRAEDPGMKVAEILDLKTTGRISSHTTSKGKVLPGYAKTTEQILLHPQVVGYGVHASNLYPDTTHVRLGHIYCQTKNGYAAVKRHGLLEVGEVLKRWDRVQAVAREMEDVAKDKNIESNKVPYNLKACNSYNRECPHMKYCERPDAGVETLFQLSMQRTVAPQPQEKEKSMGLFSMMENAPHTNGVAKAPTLPSAPPPLPQTDTQRSSAIEAEKAKLLAEDKTPMLPPRHPLEGLEGYTVGQPCNGNGWYANSSGQGFIPVEKNHVCKFCMKPVEMRVDAVNPPDGPKVDPVATIDPLPPEVIDSIADPSLKQKAQAHALAHAQRNEAEGSVEKKVKTGGRCSTGGQVVQATPEEITKKKKNCSACGKAVKITSTDNVTWTMAPHNMAKTEAATVDTQPVIPSLPTPAPAIPPAPVLFPTLFDSPPPLPTSIGVTGMVGPGPGPTGPAPCEKCAKLEAEVAQLRKTIHMLTA